jgi:hypothetical protein
MPNYTKKSTQRGTAFNPNAHDATMDNLIYWDTNAQRVRTAKHNTHDEVQYGDTPTARSPASKHLLEVITGAPHDKRCTDIMLEA